MDTTNKPEANTKLHMKFALDARFVVAVLVLIIAAMLFIWKPWVSSSDRTVEVQGQATISATPDEFVFYPSYQFIGASKEASLAALTKKSDEVVAKLKELGVSDSKIKTNSSGYDFPVYRDTDMKEVTYTLQVTITLDNKELTQKVQDYLVTTSPTGGVSPLPSFSEAKRKTLEATARDKATKDARAKADQMAQNLGFRVSRVKSVSDAASSTIFSATDSRASGTFAADAKSLAIQPGENDLPYSVTVVYYIR